MSIGKIHRLGRTRGLPQTLVRIGVAAMALGIVVPVLLMTVQRLSVARTRSRFPAPGRIVSVDGYSAHSNCLGEGIPGGPTIVLEADYGDFSLDWVGVHIRLAERYRVCAYDRAGYGWSSPRPDPRDAAHIAGELHRLLVVSGEPTPVLLVGHGVGGVYARYYAATWPDEVAGLVLVDTLTGSVNSSAYKAEQRRLLSSYEMSRFVVGSGIRRAFGPILGERALPPAARVLTSDLQATYAAFLLDLVTYDTTVDELASVQVSVEQADRALTEYVPLGDLPLVVLTSARSSPAGKGPDATASVSADAAVVSEQGELASLSSAGERRMLGRSGHLVQLDEPDAIIAAVDDVYAGATVGSSLR